MSDIPGVSLNLTGASGTQGLLAPMNAWRFYVFPRGAYASQISSGTTITFDSAAVAARFASGQWIQAGLQTANIRQVSGVGGNSITVTGAALSVAVGDRIFCIGSTQPTVVGGSATYLVPDCRIYQRDDDTSTLYTNSMVTSNADGLVQFFASANTLDAIIQDSNQGNQGFIADLTVGAAGISTSSVTTFGATVTINAALGVTGTLAVGATATFGANVGTTGYVLVGTTMTVNGNMGVTGYALVGTTLTVNGNAGVTGTLIVGATTTLNGTLLAVGISTSGGVTISTGLFGVSNQARVWLFNAGNSVITSGVSTALTFDSETYDVGGLHTGSSSNIVIPAGYGGFYTFIAAVTGLSSGGASGESRTIYIQKNGATTIAYNAHIYTSNGERMDLHLTAQDVAAAGDAYSLVLWHNHGSSMSTTGGNRAETHFAAAKLF